MKHFIPIVEGHGEVEAVPALIHKIARFQNYNDHLIVNPPIRVKIGSFLNDHGYRNRMYSLAAGKAHETEGVVLILLDCDDDCPAELGPSLCAEILKIRNDVTFLVALAYREYEAWFLASVRSLRGLHGLASDLEPPANPENIRGAKGWLGRHMDVSYDPITHQTEFTKAMNLDEARTCQSFNRLFERISTILQST